MNNYIEDLILKSKNAIKMSYSPFSGFKVGTALLCEDGSVFTAANIECSSFSLTICGERAVFAKALSEGKRKFRAIAISTNQNKIIYPCGACLQFMSEFNNKLEIILAVSPRKYKIYLLKELLPYNFKL
ncbi:MAG: cytidine deaminase [Ignavibacteria bacterium]|nr:cytidine deaminase [Ignavibacteria bacterium]